MKDDADDRPDRVALPLSPCVGVCRLDAQGLCIGCQRTETEIARWRALSDDERLHYMDHVLPARKLR